MKPRPIPAPSVAFVLAAGFGTRMRPLTDRTPKPLLPLWGQPIIHRLLVALHGWGVRHVLVNLHHAPQPLLEYLRSNPVRGLRITPLHEEEILGTGGALRAAAPYLPSDPEQPFWLVNGDIAFRDLDPLPFLDALSAAPEAVAACWAVPKKGPCTLRVEQKPPHRILAYSAPRGTGSATFAGLHLLRPAILPFLRPEGFDTIIDAYRRARAARPSRPVVAVSPAAAYWADLGTPAQYIQAHHDLAVALAPAPAAAFDAPLAAAFAPDDIDALAAALPQIARAPAAERPFINLSALPARASQRQFYRLPASAKNAPPAILVKYSDARPDNPLYAPLTRHLAAHSIPVPRLLLDRPDLHLLAIEDLGSASLQDLAADLRRRAAPANAYVALYAPLLPVLRRFHVLPPPPAAALPTPLSPAYGPDLAAWEIAYFDAHYLRARLRLPPARRAALRRALRRHAAPLLASPFGTIHRDLQSSNVLYPAPSDPFRPVLIDYQALRPGPVAYDLASLLLDPYARLPRPAVRRLLDAYLALVPDPAEAAALRAAFPHAAALRLAQALGAYARLSTLPGMAHFARYIPPARARLRDILPNLP